MVVQHAQKVLAMRPDLKVYVDFDGQMHFTNQYGIEVDEILDEFGRDLSELLDVQEQQERLFHAQRQQQAPFNAQNEQQAPFNTQHQHQVSFNAQSQQQVPFNPQPQQQVPFNPQPQQQVPFNPQPQQPVPFTAQHQPQAPFNIQHQEQFIQRAPNSGSEQELASAFLNKEFERRHKMLEQQLLQEYRTNPAAFTSPVRTNGGGLDGRTQTQAGRRVSA
ncbi:gamma-gliadin-like isoform X2 [Homarus americanus]|nr:gamma-gliadin-like isoform X2 [Homarus americanus]